MTDRVFTVVFFFAMILSAAGGVWTGSYMTRAEVAAKQHTADEERWRNEWVAVIMRPLWDDMCKAMPERCKCEPKR